MKKINYKFHLIACSILTFIMVLLEIAFFFLFGYVLKTIIMISSEVFDNKVLFISMLITSSILVALFKAIPYGIITCWNETIDIYKKIK